MKKDTITFRELYEFVDKRIGDVEALLEKRIIEVNTYVKKNDERIGVIEKFNANLTGKLAIVWFISTAVITMIFDYVKEKLTGKV